VVRRVVAAVGRLLIGLGVVILLFVVYQLWGTNLSEASAQDNLRTQFSHVHVAPPTTVASLPGETGGTAPPTPAEGNVLGIIRIPKIGVDKYLVEGVGEEDLKKGPGHYPGTPLPGQPGNAAIAGHRTTYGAPFYNLNELGAGDKIDITTSQGTFVYDVTGSQVVAPDDVSVVNPTRDNRLTLTTCNPRFSAAQRLVVSAMLETPAAPATPASSRPHVATLSGADTVTTGSSSAIRPSVGFGGGCLLLILVVWLIARRWTRGWRLGTYGIFTLPFLVLLFFFFQNVSRLLPSNF